MKKGSHGVIVLLMPIRLRFIDIFFCFICHYYVAPPLAAIELRAISRFFDIAAMLMPLMPLLTTPPSPCCLLPC